jgi:leucine-rich repeat protein SHOC2
LIVKVILGILPDALVNLKQLRELYIYDALIVNVTKQLGMLSNCSSLILKNCSLTQLPNLSALQKLWHLDLSKNRLSHLEGLPSVSMLSLSNNLFNQMPAMKSTDKLILFDINNNPLKTMPPIISFINLQALALSNTTMIAIPAAIDKLQKLRLVDFSNNKLSNLPTNIFNLPDLEELDISKNLFSSGEIQSIQKKFQKSHPETKLIV